MSVNLNWQPGMTMETVEKLTIQQALAFYRGVKATTAASLGISIRTLDAKLEKYEKEDGTEETRLRAARFEREQQNLRARGLPTLAEMPKEFHDEKRRRESAEENLKRENQLRKERGQRPLEPNSIGADYARTGAATAQRAGEIESAKSLQNSASGVHVQPAAVDPAQHEMPVPLGKEVQGVLPGQAARAGKPSRR